MLFPVRLSGLKKYFQLNFFHAYSTANTQSYRHKWNPTMIAAHTPPSIYYQAAIFKVCLTGSTIGGNKDKTKDSLIS